MKKTGVDQTVIVPFDTGEGPPPHPLWCEDDERWRLTQQVVDSSLFNKSPRLSQFLLYIVARTIEGRQSEVTEQQIGVHVFGRPRGYRTVDDNIVRNYARQLRKRLTEYFASQGMGHAMRIEIPLGGYLPAFIALAPRKAVLAMPAEVPVSAAKPRRVWPRSMMAACALFAYSATVICVTWLVQARIAARHSSPEPARLLWKAMLQGPSDTFIVPADAGSSLHGDADLRTQQLSDFANLQMVALLARLPEYNPAHVFLRFPRDLRLDDLKRANSVIIGSSCSNPWAAIADSMINFRVQCNAGMQEATILNLKPQLGESAAYTSHQNEPTHATYSVISFVPNLSGYGYMLLLGGLDAAATQAAGEALIHSPILDPILKRARRPDGSLAPFEVLLRSTSIEANATNTKVIASRIH